MLIATSACAAKTPAPPQTASSFCLIAKRISYAEISPAERAEAIQQQRAVDDPGNVADSDLTVAQVKAHNSRISCVCDDDCPAAPAASASSSANPP